jgi:hypothetical protein
MKGVRWGKKFGNYWRIGSITVGLNIHAFCTSEQEVSGQLILRLLYIQENIFQYPLARGKNDAQKYDVGGGKE